MSDAGPGEISDSATPETDAGKLTCDMCAPPSPGGTSGSLCCESTNLCEGYDLRDLCEPGFECASAEAVRLADGCTPTCEDCQPAPALEPGLLATHLDMAVAEDGTARFSGYAPGVPNSRGGRRYGDLVVGTLAPEAEAPAWEIVDGIPEEPPTNDPSGWRGGVRAAGDDVGRYTSLEVSETGATYVAYFDATHRDLKIAVRSGELWSLHTADAEGDAGRYASLALDEEGRPAIAYLKMLPGPDDSGQVVSSVAIARATTTAPASSADWAIGVVAAAPMACRPGLCAEGDTCTTSGACAQETMDCPEMCGGDRICSGGRCLEPFPEDRPEGLLPAHGLFVDLRRGPEGFGLVFYDRTTGNLWGAVEAGSAWSEAFLIDGFAATLDGTGDAGLGASFTIDGAGVWHVTYVDGSAEALRYARVVPGSPPQVQTRVIDDGTTDGSRPHPDGKHLVGDDSDIEITEAGLLRVAYQDATATRLMLATSQDGSDWTIQVLDDQDGTGFWATHRLVGSTSYVGTFWRDPPEGTSGVRLFVVE